MTSVARVSALRWVWLACGPGVAALRAHWRAFALIQLAAAALVVSYFTVPAVREACVGVAEFRERWGVWMAALASAVAGAVLPEIAKSLTGAGPRTGLAKRVKEIGFHAAFFGFSGVMVFFFYQFQGWLFGNEATLGTLVKKVVLDQFVFSVFYATPFGIFMFAWKDGGFVLARGLEALRPGRLAVRAPALLVSNWAFWIPMVSMVYSLPASLQFPLFTLALAAWSLLLVFIVSPGGMEGAQGD